jgi:hypothetical protein
MINEKVYLILQIYSASFYNVSSKCVELRHIPGNLHPRYDYEMTSICLKISVIILIFLNIKYIENRPTWQNTAILNSVVTPSDAVELLQAEKLYN